MRSALPPNFSIIIPLAIVICACSSPGRRGDLNRADKSGQTVLNVRLVESYGPSLGSGIVLMEPTGAVYNELGELFISDKFTNGVYRLSADYRVISNEGGIGTVPGSFNRPGGLAGDPALNLYVADSGNRRIQILDRNLRHVRSIKSYFDDSDNPVNFYQPEDIGIDREGNFWIADNDKVLKLDPFYELLLEMSYDAPGNFRIGRVSSIDISDNDLVAIADPGNRQIIITTIHGNYVNEFSAGKPLCARWDSFGLLWVADASAGRIEAYDVSGNMIYRHIESVSGFKPSWITFDSSDRMVVLDSGQRQVLVYKVIRRVL
ncbi:MAG: NHL repeat-containing protein [candidate division Zixibacteria bacterium]